MNEVILYITFKLNNDDLLDDWIKMSKMIDSTLEGVEGFISRDSTKDENGVIACIVKWSSTDVQKKYRQQLEESENFATIMQDFEKIVNLQSMKQEFLEVL